MTQRTSAKLVLVPRYAPKSLSGLKTEHKASRDVDVAYPGNPTHSSPRLSDWQTIRTRKSAVRSALVVLLTPALSYLPWMQPQSRRTLITKHFTQTVAYRIFSTPDKVKISTSRFQLGVGFAQRSYCPTLLCMEHLYLCSKIDIYSIKRIYEG